MTLYSFARHNCFSNRFIGEHGVLRAETFGSAGRVEELDDQDGAFPVDPLGGLGRPQGAISVVKDFRTISLSKSF